MIPLVWQYVIHPLHMSDPVTFLLLVAVGTPLIVGTAYVFYRLFERSFLRSRRLTASRATKTGR